MTAEAQIGRIALFGNFSSSQIERLTAGSSHQLHPVQVRYSAPLKLGEGPRDELSTSNEAWRSLRIPEFMRDYFL